MYRPRLAIRRLFVLVILIAVLNVSVFFHEPATKYVVDRYYGATSGISGPALEKTTGNDVSQVGRNEASDAFFETLFEQLDAAAPMKREFEWKEIKSKECNMGDVGFDSDRHDERLAYANLARCLELPEQNYESLVKGHDKFLNYLEKLDVSQQTLKQIYPTKRGIITVGGRRYSLLSYLLIQMVRRTESKLPIEVIIPPDDEPEEAFCESILKFNARCVYFKDRLPPSLLQQLDIKSYQVKGVALLLSSFEEFVFIDSDNMPLKNIDQVFDYKVYEDFGMVLWPDIWRRMTSPQFYQLANIPIDFTKRVRNAGDEISPVSRYDKLLNTANENKAKVPMHDFLGALPDPTTESGQMIVSKKSHLNVLLLSLYYNVYGPQYYYQMFSQGTSGQGDKETYALAAHVLNAPFYQVKKTFGFAAYSDPREGGGGFQGAGLLQHDPEQDYVYWNILKAEVEGQKDKYGTFDEKYSVKKSFYDAMLNNVGDRPREHLFLHASYHKFDPWNLYREKNLMHNDGKHFRAYPCSSAVFKGFDVELYLWEIVQTLFCSETPMPLAYIEKLRQKPDEYAAVCNYTNDRVQHLQDTHQEYVSYSTAASSDPHCVDIKRGH